MTGGIRTITEEMNSDMFDGIEKKVYGIEGFTKTETEQAKECFRHNGYKVYEKENELSVKKIN